MIGKGKYPVVQIYFRQCKRCDRFFHTSARRGKYCDDCKLNSKGESK